MTAASGLRLALALLGLCAYGLPDDAVTLNVKIAAPLYAVGAFAGWHSVMANWRG